MNQKALHLYNQLLTDISFCKAKGLDPMKEIESCFHISEGYRSRLRKDLISHEFDNEDEEIKFFKEIKPLFTSEAEYYSLRYHAQLFVEETMEGDQYSFWKREALRLKKFEQENRNFFEYYKAGCRDCDSLWFVRCSDKESSSHDQLVATLLALERYMGYIEKEVKIVT